MEKETSGTLGWAGLAGYVIAWDVFAPETLSHAVDRYLDHDYKKYIAWGVGGIVTGHVFNIFPDKYDPLQRTADYLGGLVSRDTNN